MHESNNFEYFNEYLRLSEDFDITKHEISVLSRPDFYLDRWLIRKEVFDNHTEEEVANMQSKMMDLYNLDEYYYDDLQPTSLAKGIAFTLKQPILKKVTVVSRVTSRNTESKERFIKRLFSGSMNKVDIYYVEKGEKKSDVISNLGMNINAIYEDEVSNINDIIKNCNNFTNGQILIPSYGYNQEIPDETRLLADSKGIEIKHFL
jgi:hypothetical protein